MEISSISIKYIYGAEIEDRDNFVDFIQKWCASNNVELDSWEGHDSARAMDSYIEAIFKEEISEELGEELYIKSHEWQCARHA